MAALERFYRSLRRRSEYAIDEASHIMRIQARLRFLHIHATHVGRFQAQCTACDCNRRCILFRSGIFRFRQGEHKACLHGKRVFRRNVVKSAVTGLRTVRIEQFVPLVGRLAYELAPDDDLSMVAGWSAALAHQAFALILRLIAVPWEAHKHRFPAV